MAPSVSVLMATYNQAEFLPEAIESVLSQSMPELELIIGDNCSTDATPGIAQRYARTDGRVRYYRNDTNVGALGNFNLCYQRSNPASKYFAIISSDDRWETTFLAKTVTAAEFSPTATVIHSDLYRTDAAGQVINRYSDLWPILPSPGLHRGVRELYRSGCYINANAALVNRKAREQLYPGDEIFDTTLPFTGDYCFWLQLLTRGAYAYYLAEPLAYYRRHERAMTVPANVMRRLREEIVIFRDRLAGVCPPELDDLRVTALRDRLASRGFVLLQEGKADEAESVLRQAQQVEVGARRPLGLAVARVISSLPLSARQRAGVWRLALAAAQAVGRAS